MSGVIVLHAGGGPARVSVHPLYNGKCIECRLHPAWRLDALQMAGGFNEERLCWPWYNGGTEQLRWCDQGVVLNLASTDEYAAEAVSNGKQKLRQLVDVHKSVCG